MGAVFKPMVTRNISDCNVVCVCVLPKKVVDEGLALCHGVLLGSDVPLEETRMNSLLSK